MISALIKGGRASLQWIGTHMDGETDLASRIKQAKRWLKSKWTDTSVHFIPYVLPILVSLTQSSHLLLAIDGSSVGKGCSALMVSAIWKGRAIPICWLVRKAPKGNFSTDMHLSLLAHLRDILHSLCLEACQVVLLADGEFDSWEIQQYCLDQRWEYVIKTAKNTLVADNPAMQGACKVGDLSSDRKTHQLFLPNVYFSKQGYGAVHLLYWHDKKYKRPLYLFSTLSYAPEIERLYRKRYRIETFFGDIKSRGFHIHKTKIADPEMLTHLLIVAALSFILAILFEPTARNSPWISKFCRKDQIKKLSIFQLGYRGLIFYLNRQLHIYFQFSKNFPIFISVRE